MKLKLPSIIFLVLVLSSCAYDGGEQGTIAALDAVQIELKDTDVEDGLDKAMAGYQKFLEKTPESQLTPEAIRRLADLKVEKEYGVVTDENDLPPPDSVENVDIPAVTAGAVSGTDDSADKNKTDTKSGQAPAVAISKESEKDFEKRATQSQKIESVKSEQIQLPKGEAGADLKNAGAEEAIRLYNQLLEKYPLYERNDQVLYQLSRAYEETGQVDKAMTVMNRLVKQFPNSRYNDEVHFRRGEYYFTRKKYLDAEDAYGEVLKMGVGTVYYERALYKKGWTFYKQELYDEALTEYFTLLDYKVSIGYDFEQTTDNIEKKRIDDTFRVVSLSFSNQGGAETIKGFFEKSGARDYEYYVYKELAEFYFTKRRYSDAAATYNMFAEQNPFHRKSPHFNMRVIDIYMKGGFPKLVIEAKKQYASTYGLEAEYWNYFNQAEYPEVLGYLKTNLTDLANHYHSLYQSKKFKKDRQNNFLEASHWYKEFLKSFPKDEQSPAINYQLADLYLENKDFDLAAIEYERSAYDYPVNENSQKAAYATVYSYREHLKKAPVSQIKNVKREIIRTSLKLVDTFPAHEKATIVLGSATDDLFEMRDFTLAIKTGRRLVEEYPNADPKIRRGAWLVVAHSSYEIEIYNDAELAYVEVLALTAPDDKSRVQLVDNLAASIYKQGEQAREEEQYREAVRHFLRIADVAPTSKIRPSAEYDAAAVLIQIMDLDQAVSVLLSFRENYPEHELQKDVTKKIAYSYKELGKYSLAANEYERVAIEAGEDEELVREAMLQAAELYEEAKDVDNSLRVYKQFVVKFPKPLEFALETYYKIAMIYKSQNDLYQYRQTLQHIIKTDEQAGEERTERTRYLAAQSSLVIIEPQFDEFVAIRLIKPFKKSLAKKQQSMKALVAKYTKLVDYEVADVTAASTYYIAEIYYNFNRSLLESERPEGLTELELEEFNLMLEDQAYPFEEKTIQVHEKNIELLSVGVYSSWIDRSIVKLARLLPARYDKPETAISYISKIDKYIYSSPRFVREDTTTGFITTLGFFRYGSQNAPVDHHNNPLIVDSDNGKKVIQESPAEVNPLLPVSSEGGTNPAQQGQESSQVEAAPAENDDMQQAPVGQPVDEASSEAGQKDGQGTGQIDQTGIAESSEQDDTTDGNSPDGKLPGVEAVKDDTATGQVNIENTLTPDVVVQQEPVQQTEVIEQPLADGLSETAVIESSDSVDSKSSGQTDIESRTGIENPVSEKEVATGSQDAVTKVQSVVTEPQEAVTEKQETPIENQETVITEKQSDVDAESGAVQEPATNESASVVPSNEGSKTEAEASLTETVNKPNVEVSSEGATGSESHEQTSNVEETGQEAGQEERIEQVVIPENHVEEPSGSANGNQN